MMRPHCDRCDARLDDQLQRPSCVTDNGSKLDRYGNAIVGAGLNPTWWIDVVRDMPGTNNHLNKVMLCNHCFVTILAAFIEAANRKVTSSVIYGA